MCAIDDINFLTYGISSDSFGPCAFEFGPKRPVIINCPFGHVVLRRCMNGIDIPSLTANLYSP